MNLQEAIQTAIQYETRVRDVYREAAKKASDPIGRKVFGALAREEQEHLHYLKARLTEFSETGKVNAVELPTGIPSPNDIQAGVARLTKTMDATGDSSEIALLEKALQVEVETRGFYHELVSGVEPEIRELFARFEEIEEGHLAIVQAELDNLKGLGFWFDYQEFDLQSG